MEQFGIHVAEADLTDLEQRLASFRAAPPPAAEPWESGVDYEYLTQLIDHWRTGLDWRRQEEWLNSYPQFMANVIGQAVHFVHARADRARYPRAVPIILSHGWPYSFVEFLPLVPLLADPLAHGGGQGDAFDVVVPSLPGYLFSTKLADVPFTGETVARLWHLLMTETLGYQRYATYGEDVGTTISDWLGALFPSRSSGSSPPMPPFRRRSAAPT